MPTVDANWRATSGDKDLRNLLPEIDVHGVALPAYSRSNQIIPARARQMHNATPDTCAIAVTLQLVQDVDTTASAAASQGSARLANQ